MYGLRATCLAGFEEITVSLVHNRGTSRPHRKSHDRMEGCANQWVHADTEPALTLPLSAPQAAFVQASR